MDYKINKLPKSKIEIINTLTPEEMEIFWGQAKKQVSAGVKIKGFRPGNAPAELVANEEEIYNVAADLAMNKTFLEIIDNEEFEPIGQAKAEILKISPNNEFQYKLTISIFPEFSAGDYKAIAKDVLKNKKEIKINEFEIDKSLYWLRKSRAKTIAVNRPSQEEDLVELEVSSSDESGEKNEPKIEKIILGESGNLLPGFEDEILGLKTNDEKEFTIKLPENYWNKEKVGLKATFKILVKNVSERQLPEINDEWAKSLGEFKTVAELKDSIKKGITKEKEVRQKEELRIKILEKLGEKVEIDIPEELINREVENKVQEIKNVSKDSELSFEEYLKKMGKDEEKIRKEILPMAEKSVKGYLILRKIGQEESIAIDEDKIKEGMEIMLSRIPKEELEKVNKEGLYHYVKEQLMNEEVFKVLEGENESDKNKDSGLN